MLPLALSNEGITMKAGIVQKNLISSRTSAANATIDITNAFKGLQFISSPNFYLEATKNGGNNCTVSIQVSFDGGTTKKEVLAFTEATANTTEVKNPTVLPWAEKVYAVYTTSTAGNYTWSLRVAGPALQGGGK